MTVSNRRRANAVLVAISVLFVATGVAAQEPAAQLPVTPNTELYAKIERTIVRIQSVFGAPLHPVISTVGPGGGLGAGLGYTSPGIGPWHSSARALYTWNRYWLAEAMTGYDGRRAQVEAFARGREMTRLNYFGPGPHSNLFDRTSYSLHEPVVGVHGKFRVLPWATLGGRVEETWPYGTSGDRPPTIELRFFPTPGLFKPTRFGRYQGSLDVQLPAAAGDGFYQGTKSRVTYAIYDQQNAEEFNFRRLDVEAQQTFAGFAPHHRLTLSGWMASLTTDAGQEIPFELLPTLGGDSEIRSVHDERLGSDGTRATLRGYRDLRFRDRNVMLLQAEYRVPLWGPIDATAFVDAGKVAPTRSDLDFNDLRRDFGISLSIMKGWETWARVDFGFGSGEGARVYFTLLGLTP
ncbi:MAG: hypothetical protein ACJ770_09475 [Gemmatimonadaceae bacterium]